MLNVLMYPSTISGEIGDILGKPRISTVKARTPTTVIKHDNGDMENVSRKYLGIAVKIFKTLVSRLKRTTRKLLT